MKLIVGLGNPGHTFSGTRHNVGFEVIQTLAQRHRVELNDRRLGPAGRPASVSGACRIGTETATLLMPLTMMNESGEALKGLTVSLQDLLIICDDVNLPLGTIRMRPDGSAGGHHGLQSSLEALGTERVARLRIGVGASEMPGDLEEFVLSRFQNADRPLVTRVVEQAIDACEAWINEGIEKAMNRYNRAVEPS